MGVRRGNHHGRRGVVQLGVVLFMLGITHRGVHAADPDPLQDFCVADLVAAKKGMSVNGYPCKDRHLVTPDDFLFTGLRSNGNTSASGTGAVITFALVADYPGLNTQGISHVRLDFEEGGVIPPHTHPLATETIFVVEGSIFTGFVSHDNVLYSKTLQKGDLFLFPRGLLHFQLNVGSGPAVAFNSFNGQMPALLMAANQLLATNMGNTVLTKSLGVSDAAVDALKAALPRYWG